MRFPLLHCRLASLLYYLDLGQFEQEFEQVWKVVSQLEIVVVVDLLVEEQAVLAEQVEVEADKQLAEDTADMVENVMDTVDGIVDMAVNMVGMVEGMMDIVESISEMVSIVVVGNFGAAMAWVHSMNFEHTSDHVQEMENSGLGTYLEVEVLAAMVSLHP